MKQSRYFNELVKETITDHNAVDSSGDLSRRIMDQIQYLPKPLNRKYEPVISTKGWIGIFISVVVAIAFATFLSKGSPPEGNFFIRDIHLWGLLPGFEFPHFVFPSLQIPEAFQMVIVLFPVLLLVYLFSERWMIIIQKKNRESIH